MKSETSSVAKLRGDANEFNDLTADAERLAWVLSQGSEDARFEARRDDACPYFECQRASKGEVCADPEHLEARPWVVWDNVKDHLVTRRDYVLDPSSPSGAAVAGGLDEARAADIARRLNQGRAVIDGLKHTCKCGFPANCEFDGIWYCTEHQPFIPCEVCESAGVLRPYSFIAAGNLTFGAQAVYCVEHARAHAWEIECDYLSEDLVPCFLPALGGIEDDGAYCPRHEPYRGTAELAERKQRDRQWWEQYVHSTGDETAGLVQEHERRRKLAFADAEAVGAMRRGGPINPDVLIFTERFDAWLESMGRGNIGLRAHSEDLRETLDELHRRMERWAEPRMTEEHGGITVEIDPAPTAEDIAMFLGDLPWLSDESSSSRGPQASG